MPNPKVEQKHPEVKFYGIKPQDIVDGIHERLKNLKKEKSRLFSLLMKFCTEKNHYIVAHFTQGVYTGDRFEGHISPVGSFDPENRRVLILDVDEDIEAPYWVSFDLFRGAGGKDQNNRSEGRRIR